MGQTPRRGGRPGFIHFAEFDSDLESSSTKEKLGQAPLRGASPSFVAIAIASGFFMPTPIVDLRPYFIPLDEIQGEMNWQEFFGNSNPVELDIGCGRGKFLVDSTIANPETNWLGLELDFTEGRHGAKRLAKRQLPNGRVIGGDAVQFLTNHVKPHSVDVARVYFPDPWWKRKHAKRRLFTDKFADLLAQVVKHGGYVHSWSDVAEYFEVISALMNHHSEFVPQEPPPEPAGLDDNDFLTGFHRRGRRMGSDIHRGLWLRK